MAALANPKLAERADCAFQNITPENVLIAARGNVPKIMLSVRELFGFHLLATSITAWPKLIGRVFRLIAEAVQEVL